MDEAEELLARFHEELAYLRGAGQGFARKHPKLAERLELDREGSADPHVERLIESFAFLTSRIQRRFDQEFPEFTSALLGLLYPNLVNPIPPMTVAQIVADPARGKLQSGYVVPSGTPLFAQTPEGLACRFRTAYPVTLWPLEIAFAGFVSRAQFDFLDDDPVTVSVLRVTLEARKLGFEELELKQLRFHLNGPQHLTAQLYELLMEHCTGVAMFERVSGRHVRLRADALRSVGFGMNEGVIPEAPESHPAYRILQEYFWLPEKFLFFDVEGIDTNPSVLELDLLFLLDMLPRERLLLTPDTFALGCTPVVNLFPRTSEPIRVDQTRTEYRVIADARRERTTEVHSILSVSATSNPAETSRQLRPLYGAAGGTSAQDAFWHSRRVPTERADASGTDVQLAFVDLQFKPSEPPMDTVFAHMLCTNRELATQLTEGSLLQTEEPAPIAHIRCLGKPTAPGYPPLAGASRWALISNLRLNYLSLAGNGSVEDSKQSLEALRRVLELYSLSGSGPVQQQLEGIREMRVRKVMRRVPGALNGEADWQSFRRGYEVRMKLARQGFVGGSTTLFAAVLREFLQLYAPLNSFVQLKVDTV